MKRKPCELRLQRNTKEVDLLLRATVKLDVRCDRHLEFMEPLCEMRSLLYDTWFAEGLRISTPITTVLLLESSAAAQLECGVGDFVIVSKKRMSSSNSSMSSDMTVLRVFFHAAVANGHCMMSEEVASQIGASYCSRIFVTKALPGRMLKSELVHITIQPVHPQLSRPTEEFSIKDSSTDESEDEHTETGAAYLKSVLSPLMNVEIFTKPQGKTDDPSHSSYIKQTAQKAVEYCSKIAPAAIESVMERLPVFKRIASEEAEDTKRLEVFLKALVAGWVEAQLEGSWNADALFRHQSSDDRHLSDHHGHPQHFEHFCFSPKCLLHFTVEGKGEKSTKMMFSFNHGENGILSEGALMSKMDVWYAMRRNHCSTSIAPVRRLPMEAPETMPSTFLNHRMPPWLETLLVECTQFLKPALDLKDRDGSVRGMTVGVMLSGAKESGKTSFASGVCQKLVEDSRFLAHVTYIPCRSLWSVMKQSFNKFSKCEAKIFQRVQEALVASPSILVFDDLDSWCAAAEDGMSLFTINSVRKRAVMMIRDIVERVRATGMPPPNAQIQGVCRDDPVQELQLPFSRHAQVSRMWMSLSARLDSLIAICRCQTSHLLFAPK